MQHTWHIFQVKSHNLLINLNDDKSNSPLSYPKNLIPTRWESYIYDECKKGRGHFIKFIL